MKVKIASFLFILGAGAYALAQTPLDKIVVQIVDNNPELKSLSSEAKAAQYELKDANSLSNPEISITKVWGAQEEAGNKFQLDVSQSFDWPGLYKARSRVANSQRVLAGLEYDASRLETALNARQLLIDLVFARKQFQLQKEILDNYKQMEDAMEVSYDKGLVTILDKKKLGIEIFKQETALAQAKERVQELEQEICVLAPSSNLDLSQITDYPLDALNSEEEYRQAAFACDPALQALRLTESTAALEAKAARQSRLPGFSVGYEYQSESGMTYNGFTMGMTLPIFENRKARAAALVKEENANNQIESLKNELTLGIDRNLSKAKLWQSQIEAYNRTFGGDEYVKLLNQAYQGGQISLLDYLSELQYYRETANDFIEAQYNYASALSDLNRYTLLDALSK